MDEYPPIKAKIMNGDEPFHKDGKPLPFNLSSFWQWSSSDLIGNAMRGILAEYIVASAVDGAGGIRTEWDAFDIATPENIKIEVKSSAYIQSWFQKKRSNISFGIQPTRSLDPTNNTYSDVAERQADIYVFCVLAHKDQNTIDPLNLDQWEFYIIATDRLNELVGNQKTISLSSLEKLNPVKVNYGKIKDSVLEIM